MNLFEKVRRNHGIEHATVHVLSEGNPTLQLVGRADANGFIIIGDVSAEELASSAQEALRRMKNGQGDLAVHPRCGTQLVTLGALTALAAFVTLGRRPRLARLPDAILATTLAAIAAQPLGLSLQRYITTSPNVANAHFLGVTRKNFAGVEYWHVDIGWNEDDSLIAYRESPIAS
ncbi:MAG TPA: DUF6391 domain-containing protein [Anaerolineae bacterium]|nr:DUF6391 domain-containing protein [Anaerolineae bacterium]